MAIAVGFPPQSKKICGVRESSTATAATVRAAGARNGPWSTAERPAQKTRYDAAAASRPARASPSGDSSATTAENPRGYAPAWTPGHAGESAPWTRPRAIATCIAMSAPGATARVTTGTANAPTASDQSEKPICRCPYRAPIAAPRRPPTTARVTPAVPGSVATAAPAIAPSRMALVPPLKRP